MQINKKTILYVIEILLVGTLTGFIWIMLEQILEELLKHKLTFINEVLTYIISWVLANAFYFLLKNN